MQRTNTQSALTITMDGGKEARCEQRNIQTGIGISACIVADVKFFTFALNYSTRLCFIHFIVQLCAVCSPFFFHSCYSTRRLVLVRPVWCTIILDSLFYAYFRAIQTIVDVYFGEMLVLVRLMAGQ